jgi:glycine/D-amino acid oxidase-like deaminating enzyme
MSPGSPDVIVIGAGIVGAACAYELARDKFRVTIIDGHGIATGTTGAGMGHVVVMDDSEAQLLLTRYSQTLWDALFEEFPSSFSLEKIGTIWVAADEEEAIAMRRKSSFYTRQGIENYVLGRRELEEAEPHLRKGLFGGLLVPQDSVLYPPEAAAFLLQKACEAGAMTYFGKSVSSIRKQITELADGTRFHAPTIVNAAGQRAAELTPGIEVVPRKGHLVITDRYPGTVHHQLVELGYVKSAHTLTEDSVAFNVQPRKTGQLLIGSSRQTGVTDSDVDPPILSKMLNRAFEFMPELAHLSAIRVWTGFRSATPDKLPLIGPWEKDSSIFLAVGHEGLGITTSLATGRLIADSLLGRTPVIPSEPYLPSRPFKAGVLV